MLLGMRAHGGHALGQALTMMAILWSPVEPNGGHVFDEWGHLCVHVLDRVWPWLVMWWQCVDHWLATACGHVWATMAPLVGQCVVHRWPVGAMRVSHVRYSSCPVRIVGVVHD